MIPCNSWPDCLKSYSVRKDPGLWWTPHGIYQSKWHTRSKSSCPLGSISLSVATRSRRICVPICLALDTELRALQLERDLDELERLQSRAPMVVRSFEERLTPMSWACLMQWWLQDDHPADHSCSRRGYRDDRVKLLSDTAWGMHSTAFVGVHIGYEQNTGSAGKQCSSGAGTQGAPGGAWRFCSTPDLALAVAVLWQESWVGNPLRSKVFILHLLKPVIRHGQLKDWKVFQLHLLAQLKFFCSSCLCVKLL